MFLQCQGFFLTLSLHFSEAHVYVPQSFQGVPYYKGMHCDFFYFTVWLTTFTVWLIGSCSKPATPHYSLLPTALLPEQIHLKLLSLYVGSRRSQVPDPRVALGLPFQAGIYVPIPPGSKSCLEEILRKQHICGACFHYLLQASNMLPFISCSALLLFCWY